ncbi:hypothetical protein N7451_006819 [Penicillium sp. IBT 35674x]|nr:hypothetical protein N7451_006819 [Penicillium sp. IBT 35674x]
MGLLEWDFVHLDLWLRLAKIISGVMALVADPETPSAGLQETDTSHIPFAARGCSVHGVPSSPSDSEEKKAKPPKDAIHQFSACPNPTTGTNCSE